MFPEVLIENICHLKHRRDLVSGPGLILHLCFSNLFYLKHFLVIVSSLSAIKHERGGVKYLLFNLLIHLLLGP